MIPPKSLSLMIIEDSEEDYYAMTRILERKSFSYPISRLEDGDAAVNHFLNRTDKNGEKPLPTLILLDLNLPGTDGREILQFLKSREETRSIPIVITTTSANPQDVAYCYEKGADGYFIKPVDFQHLQHALTTITDYWFEIITPKIVD